MTATSGGGDSMDVLTFLGVVAAGLMLLFYAVEDRSPRFVLAFAGSCILGSIYGFLQGAWPFGVLEAIWSIVAWRRFRSRLRGDESGMASRRQAVKRAD